MAQGARWLETRTRTWSVLTFFGACIGYNDIGNVTIDGYKFWYYKLNNINNINLINSICLLLQHAAGWRQFSPQT